MTRKEHDFYYVRRDERILEGSNQLFGCEITDLKCG
jgi:hypothetical protein